MVAVWHISIIAGVHLLGDIQVRVTTTSCGPWRHLALDVVLTSVLFQWNTPLDPPSMVSESQNLAKNRKKNVTMHEINNFNQSACLQ